PHVCDRSHRPVGCWAHTSPMGDLDDTRARESARSRDAHHDKRQRILNAHPIPPLRDQKAGWIHCRARVVYELDGEEWMDTVAYAWTSRLVLVQRVGLDHRWDSIGVWLDAADVRRRVPRVGER